MSHVMLTEYQLANFHKLMKAGRGFPLSDLGPQGAFNSMPKSMSRRAKDADPESVARGLANILLTLKESLGEEVFKELCENLCADEPEEAEDDSDEPTGGEKKFTSPEAREQEQLDKPAKDRRRAKNSPPDFEGMPKTHAEDSAADPRFDYLRDAMRVRPGTPGTPYGDVSSKVRRAPSTASAERSFQAMYGNAALDIKVR